MDTFEDAVFTIFVGGGTFLLAWIFFGFAVALLLPAVMFLIIGLVMRSPIFTIGSLAFMGVLMFFLPS